MSLERDISLLSRIGIFADLPSDNLRLLAFSAVRHELPAGTTLFEKGAPAKSGYVISSGQIELCEGASGNRSRLALCEVGMLIGEMALLVDTPRPATAIAVVDSDVMELSRALMTRMFNEYPQVAARLRGSISERLRVNIAELWKIRGTRFAETRER